MTFVFVFLSESECTVMQPVNKMLYSCLQRLEMSESDLRRFCFPRALPSQPGKAQLFNIKQSYNRVIPGYHRRTCRRCNTVYAIHDNGRPVIAETCTHHWGKLSHTNRPIYHCCTKPRTSLPCSTAPQHVSEDIDPDNLTGFINTGLNSHISTESIYALDCEMLYTTAGMDLAAISIVDSNCHLVYETMVLPDAPIIDYNTEYSGLKEEHFRGVTTRLGDVHGKLLSLVGSRTILVGHGLDHDLLRLKVIHDRIVDTSAVYPHPKGFPVRHKLSALMDIHFGMKTKPSSTFKCRGDAEAAMKLACRKC